jgi:hypothetical protein
MKKWLTSLFLILALSGGVLAGMPLHAGNTNSQMMKCCKKAKSKDQTPAARAARLCCVLNCTDPAPTSQGASFNFSPAGFTISDSIAKQIASLLLIRLKPDSTIPDDRETTLPPSSRKFPPKYIQHHSILI